MQFLIKCSILYICVLSRCLARVREHSIPFHCNIPLSINAAISCGLAITAHIHTHTHTCLHRTDRGASELFFGRELFSLLVYAVGYVRTYRITSYTDLPHVATRINRKTMLPLHWNDRFQWQQTLPHGKKNMFGSNIFVLHCVEKQLSLRSRHKSTVDIGTREERAHCWERLIGAVENPRKRCSVIIWTLPGLLPKL